MTDAPPVIVCDVNVHFIEMQVCEAFNKTARQRAQVHYVCPANYYQSYSTWTNTEHMLQNHGYHDDVTV
jgi:hypothetical protein